jgi:hypothetical protein
VTFRSVARHDTFRDERASASRLGRRAGSIPERCPFDSAAVLNVRALSPRMRSSCPECGAPLGDADDCRALFHELLALEARVAGAAGALPHFFAVASYNLQHPSTFTRGALEGLRPTLADVLAGRATLDDARRRARAGAAGAARVRRRPDDADTEEEQRILRAWPTRWPLTVADVCRAEPEEYAARVRAWAEGTIATLEAVP